MSREDALRTAITLVKVPAQVRALRTAPLPAGTLLLLNVAAGDCEAEKEAADLTGRPVELLREAAGFYIEQVLLYPGADSYRMLGAHPETPALDLRAHMAALMRWLHPDLNRSGERAQLATRVLRAWDDLKSSERRQAYDTKLHAPAAHGKGKHQPPAYYRMQQRAVMQQHGPARRMLQSVLGYFGLR